MFSPSTATPARSPRSKGEWPSGSVCEKKFRSRMSALKARAMAASPSSATSAPQPAAARSWFTSVSTWPSVLGSAVGAGAAAGTDALVCGAEDEEGDDEEGDDEERGDEERDDEGDEEDEGVTFPVLAGADGEGSALEDSAVEDSAVEVSAVEVSAGTSVAGTSPALSGAASRVSGDVPADADGLPAPSTPHCTTSDRSAR